MARFLLCDDSKFMTMITERMLTKMGHQVVYKSSDGLDAIAYYLDHFKEIDIVLLDVVMPKIDGLQALRQLFEINPDAKILMLTSISNSSIVGGALKLGAKDFITKPFKMLEFSNAIDKIVSE
ncbi:MAG: response regulator [Candidatus Heimdallarchaeota archaeon]|nr:response regulator [Candidatus Heimdallarchaeota archaeon]